MIKQVADVNVKGIFITNNGFQHEAFTFAKSVGMMLITDNDSITLNIILRKANSFRQLEQERFHANFSLEKMKTYLFSS